jgi:hypothetical protein
LLVGGAMYADPAAALARNGGRFFEPDTFLYPTKTPISEFIPGSVLQGSTGKLTLDDFAAISDLNKGTLEKLEKEFSDVTLGDIGDIGDIVAYQIDTFGSTTSLLGRNATGEDEINCCCCCCTTKIIIF